MWINVNGNEELGKVKGKTNVESALQALFVIWMREVTVSPHPIIWGPGVVWVVKTTVWCHHVPLIWPAKANSKMQNEASRQLFGESLHN